MRITSTLIARDDAHSHKVFPSKNSRAHVDKARIAMYARKVIISGPHQLALLSVFLLLSTYNYSSQLFTTISGPWSWQETMKSYPKMCFVTAQFAAHVNSTDKLFAPATKQSLYKHAKFLVFTNLQDFQAPKGWEIISRNYTQYTRSITQSRVPKFQGIHDPAIYENCQVVFYLDGSVEVLGSLNDFSSDAQRILHSDVGLMQPLHPMRNNIHDTFETIRKYGKDTQYNLNVTRQWFHQQPDYFPEIPVYHNMYFGYDVRSTTFQQVADYFWSVYSKEIGSWRDQPLWAYTLHHFNVTPLNFQGFIGDNDHDRNKILFKRIVWREGLNGHTYATKLEYARPERSSVYSPSTRRNSKSQINHTKSMWSKQMYVERLCRLWKEEKIVLAASFEKHCVMIRAGHTPTQNETSIAPML